MYQAPRNNRLALIALILLSVLILATGCRVKKETVSTENTTAIDTTILSRKDSIIDILATDTYNKTLELIKVKEQLANTLKGKTGRLDTFTPTKTLTLHNGPDSVYIIGVWDVLNWKWYTAPRKQTNTVKTDSSSFIRSEYEQKISRLQKEALTYRRALSEKKVVRVIHKTNWKHVIIALAAGLVVGFIISKRL